MNAFELYAERERLAELAGVSGGYPEYRIRCACENAVPNMDETTFETYKRLNAGLDARTSLASVAKPAFEEWRELIGELSVSEQAQ